MLVNISINTAVSFGTAKVGVGVYVDNLIENLVRIYPSENFFAFHSEDSFCASYEYANLKRIPLSGKYRPSFRFLFNQREVAAVITSTQSAIYHVPNTVALLPQKCGVITSILDLQEFRTNKYGPFVASYRKIANFIATRASDAIITISEHSKKDIVDILRVPPQKVFVTYLAHSQVYRVLDKAVIVPKIFATYRIEKYLITVGDIQKGKNILRLVEAYAILRNKYGITHELVLVGKERKPYPELHQKIHALGLTNFVKFLGYVPTADLVELYNAAQVCIYPSLYEGFGLPILEAMACGVPVATSNVSSIPEVAGKAAALFNPYDVEQIALSIAEILKSQDMAIAMREAGLQQVKLFSWENTAHNTMKVYQSVYENKHTRR